MSNIKIPLLIILCLLLASCVNKSDSTGDPKAGEALFNQATLGAAPGCKTCHSTEPGKIIIGPSLAGVASRAGERTADQTAEEYLRNCIVEPNQYVVEGFPSGVMYQNFKDVLSAEQINNLVAYLSTLQ